MSHTSRFQIGLLTAIVAVASTACGSPKTPASGTAASGHEHAPPQAAPPSAPLRVAVAMDAGPAFKEIGDAYARATGATVEFSPGRSGELADDVQGGAPYDVYISPKPQEIDRLVEAKVCVRELAVVYGQQRIAMYSKPGVEPPKQLSDLADPKFAKIVMTLESPYGRLARDAMIRHGVWETVSKKLIETHGMDDFKSQAEKGDVGITPVSVAVRLPGKYVEIDPSEYKKVPAQAIACKAGNPAPSDAAKRFLEFVGKDAARAILKKSGFY